MKMFKELCITMFLCSFFLSGITIAEQFNDNKTTQVTEQKTQQDEKTRDEGNLGDDIDYKTSIRRGLLYVKREKYGNALEVFRTAAEFDPARIEAHNNMGACLLNIEKYNEALVEFVVCENLNPKDAEVHINLAITYYFLADYKNAKEEYLKAAAINSELSKDPLYIKLIENGTVPAKNFLPKIIWKTPK